MSGPVVLIDRDGTILEQDGYLLDPHRLRLLPGAAEALGRLRRGGFRIAIVTNQSPIGRGLLSWGRLRRIHERLTDELRRRGVTLDGIFVCPHRPEDGCRCRKPQPGLVWQAAARLRFDPASCWIVGDNACDVDLARAVGARSVLVETGHGAALPGPVRARADRIAADLAGAAGAILEHARRERPAEALV